MRKGKKLVSMLLTAAMLVTMLSGVSITAFAAAFNVDTLVQC